MRLLRPTGAADETRDGNGKREPLLHAAGHQDGPEQPAPKAVTGQSTPNTPSHVSPSAAADAWTRRTRKRTSIVAPIAQTPSASRKAPVSAEGRRPSFSKNPSRQDGVFRQAIETGRTRLLITGTVLTLAFALVAGRLVEISAFHTPAEPNAAKVAATTPTPKDRRGEIVDRNGVLIATNLSTVSLVADPKFVQNPRETAYKLASVLPGLDVAETEERLRRQARFVPLKRTLTPQQQFKVNGLGLPGIDFDRKQTRVYPHGRLFSHVIGLTDTDNQGIAGLELRFNEELRQGAAPLRLSLDVRIQHLLHQELSSAISTYSAIGGAGIVTDVSNGEVIAMVSLPDFDPNDPVRLDSETLFNRATKGVYELGSTFKIFNTALGLETGTVSMADGYDASEPIKIGRYRISDFHAKNRWLTVPEIFIYSSNIGSAKMALDVGTQEQKLFFERLGFLEPIDLELPEVGLPQSPGTWRPVNTMTISFGHGLAVSPMHLINGVASMVNGGRLFRPTLVRSEEQPEGRPIVSARTSNAIRALMHLNAVEGSGGSGSNASVPGYVVGGKTGTAEKAGAGRYNRKARISSFVGAFPMHDPKYAIYIVLDEPKGTKETFGYATGGWVAAPVVAKVVARMAPLLGVQPVDDLAPEIRQHFAILPPQMNATLASLQ